MANFFKWDEPNPVVADETLIRSAHIIELCDNMNLVRAYIKDFKRAQSTSMGRRLGQSSHNYSFTDYPVTPDVDTMRTAHINDLRDALDDINEEWTTYNASWTWCEQYSNSGAPGIGFRVQEDVHRVRSVHINELRSQLDLVDSSMNSVSPYCGTACQLRCQTNCQLACQHSCQQCNNHTCHNQMCGVW